MTVEEALNKGIPAKNLNVAQCEYCDAIENLEHIPGVGWLCPVHLQEYEDWLYNKHLELLNEELGSDPNF